MPHVTLHTPIDPELSSGILCFEVEGLSPFEVVDRFHERRVIASSSPYRVSYPRLAPSPAQRGGAGRTRRSRFCVR